MNDKKKLLHTKKGRGTKRTFNQIGNEIADRSAKKARIDNVPIQLRYHEMELSFYLMYKGRYIPTNYKNFLCKHFNDILVNKWKKGGFQSEIITRTDLNARELMKKYNYPEILLVILNNCVPITRNIK